MFIWNYLPELVSGQKYSDSTLCKPGPTFERSFPLSAILAPTLDFTVFMAVQDMNTENLGMWMLDDVLTKRRMRHYISSDLCIQLRRGRCQKYIHKTYFSIYSRKNHNPHDGVRIMQVLLVHLFHIEKTSINWQHKDHYTSKPLLVGVRYKRRQMIHIIIE